MKNILYQITRILIISAILLFTLSAQLCNDYAYTGGENPLLTYGESYYYPWSGWWWPMLNTHGPHLYDSYGPLEKYDSFVLNNNDISTARQWELNNDYTTDPANDWWGHCNGWAAASILYDEPTSEFITYDVIFNIGDIKGILTEWCMPAEHSVKCGYLYPYQSLDPNDPLPHLFHRFLVDNIGDLANAVIVDTCGGTCEQYGTPKVWSYPVYKYWMTYTTDPFDDNKYHVECKIRFVSNNVAPDDVGTYYLEKYYYYWISGDKRYPTNGMWETAADGGYSGTTDSVYDHPDYAWYPKYPIYHECLNYYYVNKIIYHLYRTQGEDK